MNYPFWEIPILGSGWVIGIIAIFHVMISQFAVGGGLYLPMAERKALGMKDAGLREAWLAQLVRHTKFFLILTAVFGTVSGVAIWFAIGLTHPEATSMLIHNFVFGWAMEWVFFMIELTTVAVYFYTWNRVDPKLHLAVGWVYAAASFFTLVIINGILSFMLTPGDTWISVAGTGHEASKFWNAFFNPTYWPSLVLRMGICASLAGVWMLIAASRINGDKQPALKTSLVQWSVKWLMPVFVAAPLLLAWYLRMVPDSQLDLLTLGISTISPGVFAGLTRMVLLVILTSVLVVCVAYFLAYRNPRGVNLPQALGVLLLALIATGAGEYSRELLRKPYVIGRWMFANGVRVPQVNHHNAEGYLVHTQWMWNGNGAGSAPTSYTRGEAIFRGQCGSCHTLHGYRPMVTFLNGRDHAGILSFINILRDYKPDSPYRRYMPPMVGTGQDVQDLGDYLNAQVNPAVPVSTAMAEQPK